MCGISGLILRKNTLGYDKFDDPNVNTIENFWTNGYNSKKFDFVESIIKGMLLTSSLRGTDSTGLLAVNGDDEYVAKLPIDPLSFFETPQFQTATLKTFQDNIGFIAHTRSATIGKISRITAHPHEFDNVIGVHNGTLKQWTNLYKNGLTDSHAIFGALDVAVSPTDVLKKLDGSYALAWYDRISGNYYFARNNDRPLAYIHSPEGLFFASEWVMLRFALERALGTQEYKALCKDSVINEFKTETLYEFNPKTFEFKTEKYEKEQRNLVPVQNYNTNFSEYEQERNKLISDLGLKKGYKYPVHPAGYEEYGKGTHSSRGTLFIYFKDYNTDDIYYSQIYGIENVKERFEEYSKKLEENPSLYLWAEFEYLYVRSDLNTVTVEVDGIITPCKTIKQDGKDKCVVINFKSTNLELSEIENVNQ